MVTKQNIYILVLLYSGTRGLRGGLISSITLFYHLTTLRAPTRNPLLFFMNEPRGFLQFLDDNSSPKPKMLLFTSLKY